MIRPHALSFVALAGALAIGCGSDPAPPPKTSGMTPAAGPNAGSVSLTPKLDVASPSTGSVQIEDKILKACGDIPTARFAFDSAAIAGDAAAALDALARCFVTGPLKDKGMRLVGHADARGEVEYNLALGQQRASSVSTYLGTKGLAGSRIATSSKGEFDATGEDDEGWARDRKVEVFLAD